MYVPPLSTVLVDADIRNAYAVAEKRKEAPRDAWLMQCVQEDRSNPIPCTDEDKQKFGKDGTTNPYVAATQPTGAPSASAAPSGGSDADDLMKQMMGGGDTPKKDEKKDEDDLMKQMMGGDKPAPSAKPVDPNEELMKQMMGDDKKK
jgi:hypothetical protein